MLKWKSIAFLRTPQICKYNTNVAVCSLSVAVSCGLMLLLWRARSAANSAEVERGVGRRGAQSWWLGGLFPPGSREALPCAAGPAKRQVAVKSTRGFALKSTHGIAVKPANLAAAEKGESAPVCRTTRQFYDGEESCYIIDAKLEGNLGRYLNVSRCPAAAPRLG